MTKPPTPKIGLCMIVKNEVAIIERCLDSVKPLIDYACICDTGSTDSTIYTIRSWLKRNDIPGKIYTTQWKDFASNRTEAFLTLRAVVPWTGYAFMIDADDTLVIDPDTTPEQIKNGLEYDVYDLQIHQQGTTFWQPHIWRNDDTLDPKFGFKGVTHEYLDVAGHKQVPLHGLHINLGNDSSRRKSGKKELDDIALLQTALRDPKLQDHALIARYFFYLAQCYYDLQRYDKALYYYVERTNHKHWVEEVYISWYRAGKCKVYLKCPTEEILDLFDRASRVAPWRAEALCAAASICRLSGDYNRAYEYAKRATLIPAPQHSLFVEQDVYNILAAGEMVTAYQRMTKK